jgi:phospholipase C
VGITRRELLQAGVGAGVGAGALALGANPLIQQALARKLPPGELSDIEHVVILIQENRSFDHYFGMLPGVRGFADPSAPRSIFEQTGYPQAGYDGVLMPFHPEGGPTPGERCFPDITHSWVPQHESWDNGAMDGFVRTHLAVDGEEAGPATMGYYTREDIPFYYALAESFTICDNYHCSVLGPTYPNRLMSMSASIDPEGRGGGPLVETYEDFEYLKGRFTWTTMPEQLSAAGVSWKVYTGAELGYEDNVLEFFENFQTNPELKARGIEPVYPNDFVADLKNEELPQVSWINTSALQTEHPGYSSAKVGEFVVENLMARLHKHGAWDKTALFLTWDENGGFFDHVPPPVPPPGTTGEYLTVPDITGNDGGITGPIGLGFRVPLLIISPFSRGGFLSSDTFDHTSLLRFLETRFGVEVPNLSQWRRETTGDLTSAFNFVQPRDGRGRLPKVTLTPEELTAGACETVTPLSVPPNSFPQEEARIWKTPSGL